MLKLTAIRGANTREKDQLCDSNRQVDKTKKRPGCGVNSLCSIRDDPSSPALEASSVVPWISGGIPLKSRKNISRKGSPPLEETAVRERCLAEIAKSNWVPSGVVDWISGSR